MRFLPMAIQCVIACLIGSAVYFALWPNPNPKVPLVGGLLAGFSGSWAATFFYVWARHGWQAAKSMTMSPIH